MYEKETESNVDRYLAYFGRLGRLAQHASQNLRYAAYASEVGESFRPITSSWFVRGCYGISWLYIGYDVQNHANHESKALRPKSTGTSYLNGGLIGTLCYKNRFIQDEVYRRAFTERLVFQSLASMLAPAMIIHFVVHSVSTLVKKIPDQPISVTRVQNASFKRWSPVIAGLVCIPALPFICDKPIEHVTEYVFERVWPKQIQ